MKLITSDEINTLKNIYCFFDTYVNDIIDLEENIHNENVSELNNYIEILKKIITREDFNINKLVIKKETLIDLDEIDDSKIKNIIKSSIRKGKESVNPHFKYCVINSNLSSPIYLTDDIGIAMNKASTLAKLDKYFGFYYVLRISKDDDGTYKTYFESTHSAMEKINTSKEGEEFVHFNYLLEANNNNVIKL